MVSFSMRKTKIALTSAFIICLLIGILGNPLSSKAQSQKQVQTLTPQTIIVIQATPIPQTTPSGNILQELWETKKVEILFSIITLILIGVFLRQITEAIAKSGGEIIKWLSRTFADWVIFRRRLYQDYVTVLDEETNKWQFSRTQVLEKDQFYISVHVTKMPASFSEAEGQEQEWQEAWIRRRREQKIEPRQALLQFERLAIVGEPGVGKTTLLRYLAFLYAHDRASDSDEQLNQNKLVEKIFRTRAKKQNEIGLSGIVRKEGPKKEKGKPSRSNYKGWQLGHRVPVYISLKELVGITDLATYLVDYFTQHNYPNANSFIKTKLERGEFLFLLDALDEVDEPEKLPVVVDLVARFASRYSNQQHPNWIVVTSRPQSYQLCVHTLNFQIVELLEFEPQQIRDFIGNWFAKEPKRGERLWEIISHDSALLEVGSNPLMLTLIVESYNLRNELATNRRVELFGQIVNVRFWEWDSIRRVQRDFKFTQTTKENFLKQLALDLNASNRSIINQSELLERTRAFLIADGKANPDEADSHHGNLARRFIWEVAEGSGILYQKAITAYDFSHKTLREYFTALRLCDLPDGLRVLLTLLQGPTHDRWEMVALLYAGRTADATSLVRAIWQADRNLTKRGLLLAARCLYDAANVRDRQRLTNDVCDALLTALMLIGSKTEARKEGITLLKAIGNAQLENYIARILSENPNPNQIALATDLMPDKPSEGLHKLLSEQLQKTLTASDEATRSQAAFLLAQASIDEAAVPLMLGLEASDPSVRIKAAQGLARLGRSDPMILDAIRRNMSMDSEQVVRFACRDALLLLGCAKELDMVKISEGDFLMGTSEEQCAYLLKRYNWDASWATSELPQRKVFLGDYYIDRNLVTNAAFAVFTASTGYQTIAEQAGTGFMKIGQKSQVTEVRGVDWSHPRGPGSTWEEIPDHPVVLLTWQDVMAYAEWAGKKLPSEAQWEKAARGTDGRIWPWGNEWEEGLCNTASYHTKRPLLNDNEWMMWFTTFDQIKYGPSTTPVGSFPGGSSPYGVLDCAGNVCERTTDWYKAYPGSRYVSEHFGEKYHVLRGGAWHHHANLARVSARDFAHPMFRTVHDGFRCVVEIPVE